MLTRKIMRRDEFNQNARQIHDERLTEAESLNQANNSTASAMGGKLMANKSKTRRRTEGYNFQRKTKKNMTSPYLSYELELKRIVLNATNYETLKGHGDKITVDNAPFTNRLKHRYRLSDWGKEIKSKVKHNVRESKVVLAAKPTEHQVQRRSSITFSASSRFARRKGMNPCVKRIVKIYYGKLNRVLTDCKCRRASFYCSPKLGGLGRCMPVKTFYPSINEILTTACKCR